MARTALAIADLTVFGDSLSDSGNLFRLIGLPQPPAWNGRSSNGPTYAEQLANFLGVNLDDRAFGAAEASTSSPPVLTDPDTGNRLPIDLPAQVASYTAQLNGNEPSAGTAALIFIGSNDYVAFLGSNPPTDPASVQAFVASVVNSVAQAIAALTQAGVGKIILFTLPDLGITPDAQAAGPEVAGFATLLAEANNAALRQLAAAMPNVELVDEFQISDVLAADPHALGFRADLTATWQDLLDAGSIRFAPNEVAFFNGIHPTTAAHGVLAAFADAVLTADHVQFPDETNDIVRAGPGDNFIFVPPNPGASGPITIFGGCGDDVIFAGSGDVTVHGGSGNDLIFSGSGNVHLEAGNGTDVLATNSLGTNILAGGNGDDALIVNRGGTNTITGGKGADLFVLKEDASLVNADGSFRFGEQVISGGRGSDTLRFIINDQDPNLESALITEFQKIEAEFDAVDHGAFSFDGLTVSGIERLELQVDSVSRDPVTPWLITHGTVLSDGHAAPTS